MGGLNNSIFIEYKVTTLLLISNCFRLSSRGYSYSLMMVMYETRGWSIIFMKKKGIIKTQEKRGYYYFFIGSSANIHFVNDHDKAINTFSILFLKEKKNTM